MLNERSVLARQRPLLELAILLAIAFALLIGIPFLMFVKDWHNYVMGRPL